MLNKTRTMQPAKLGQPSPLPSLGSDSSLIPRRKRGRPKGSLNKKIFQLRSRPSPVEKALVSLQHVAEDTVLAAATFDGGGTLEDSPVITKESLERRIARRLNVLDRYLTDARLTGLLEISGLKEIGIYEGIMMDKALVLKGQPTVIVGSADRANMETVLPKLLNELRRRKLVTTVSERKIEFQASPGQEA